MTPLRYLLLATVGPIVAAPVMLAADRVTPGDGWVTAHVTELWVVSAAFLFPCIVTAYATWKRGRTR